MARRKRADIEDDTGPPAPAGDAPADRRLRAPPPLTEGSEPFEGADILDELEDELGGLLWSSLRSATLWARVNPARREELAAPAAAARRLAELDEAAVPPALAEPLHALAKVVSEPTAAQAEAVADACRAVAEWASAGGMPGTALAYLQGAALARPDDPGISYAVGRMAQRRGESTRAESWLQHAIVQARRGGDWETYTLVYASLGNLYAERGSLPAARRALTRAFRSAQRHSLRALQGEAQHDLFAIAAQAGRVREAERLAAAALEIYGEGHERLPYLARDLAMLWVERQVYGAAMTVARELEPHLRGFPERLLLLAATARAAGGLGDREAFRRAWEAAENEVPPAAVREGVAAALLDLAIGAELLGDRDRARSAAARAAEMAARTKEGRVRTAAAALVDRVDRGSPPEAPREVPERSRERSERLAERLAGLLAEG